MQTIRWLEGSFDEGSELKLTLRAEDVVDFEIAAAAAGWSVRDTGERIMTDTDDEVVLVVTIPPTVPHDDAGRTGRRTTLVVQR